MDRIASRRKTVEPASQTRKRSDNGAAITAVDRFGRLPLHLVHIVRDNGFSARSIVVAESGASVRIRLGVLNANINSSLRTFSSSNT